MLAPVGEVCKSPSPNSLFLVSLIEKIQPFLQVEVYISKIISKCAKNRLLRIGKNIEDLPIAVQGQIVESVSNRFPIISIIFNVHIFTLSPNIRQFQGFQLELSKETVNYQQILWVWSGLDPLAILASDFCKLGCDSDFHKITAYTFQ